MSAPRTDAEIVAQTEELAAKLNQWRWGGKLTDGATYRNSQATKARACWEMACLIQELLTDTDPENSVAEVDCAHGSEAEQFPDHEFFTENYRPPGLKGYNGIVGVQVTHSPTWETESCSKYSSIRANELEALEKLRLRLKRKLDKKKGEA